MDTIDFIITYESGALDDEEVIAGFQDLIDSGTVWSLQGHYGRTARRLIELGHCREPEPEPRHLGRGCPA